MSYTMDEQRVARMLDDALTARQSRAGGALADQALGQTEIDVLLALAATLEADLAPASPTRGAVARTRARVLNRVGAARKSSQRTAPPRRRPSLFRRYAFAMASLFLVFAMLASGTGVAFAAESSLPGDGLYGVKLGLESTRLALTFSPEARGAYLRGLADERMSEIQSLLQTGREGDLPAAVESYSNTLAQIEQAAGNQDEANLVQTRANLEHHLQVLQMLMTSAPQSARSGLENALTKSHHGIDVINAVEQGLDPSQLAPGQLKKTPSADDVPGNGSGNQGKGPPSDHTPGPPGGPPGQNKDGGFGSSGRGNGPPGSPPGKNK
jgi:hypothetical protein